MTILHAAWSPNRKQPSIVLVHQQLHLCDLLPCSNQHHLPCSNRTLQYCVQKQHIHYSSTSEFASGIIIKLNTLCTFYDIGILLFPFHISRPVQQSGPLYQRLCSHNNMINNIIIAGDKIFSHNYKCFSVQIFIMGRNMQLL